MTRNNHFITVSRTGELMARRKGGAPVRVATAAAGLVAEPDAAARANGAPATVRVHFSPGGGNRRLYLTAIEVDGERLDVDAFLARYLVPEEALARWIRAVVGGALDGGT